MENMRIRQPEINCNPNDLCEHSHGASATQGNSANAGSFCSTGIPPGDSGYPKKARIRGFVDVVVRFAFCRPRTTGDGVEEWITFFHVSIEPLHVIIQKLFAKKERFGAFYRPFASVRETYIPPPPPPILLM
jgi:hypothetical protein